MSSEAEGREPDEPSTSHTIRIKDLHALLKALEEPDEEVPDCPIPNPKVHSAMFPFELRITPKSLLLDPETSKLLLAHISRGAKIFNIAFKLWEYARTLRLVC
jgi:hypothetical protein